MQHLWFQLPTYTDYSDSRMDLLASSAINSQPSHIIAVATLSTHSTLATSRVMDPVYKIALFIYEVRTFSLSIRQSANLQPHGVASCAHPICQPSEHMNKLVLPHARCTDCHRWPVFLWHRTDNLKPVYHHQSETVSVAIPSDFIWSWRLISSHNPVNLAYHT